MEVRMNGKYKIKCLRNSILIIMAFLSMGVVECPPNLGSIVFENYTDSSIVLSVDTLVVTTLKQNSIERWRLEFWKEPYLTLYSFNEGRRFGLAPYYDSISRDTIFYHRYQVTARINDSVIYKHVFPPLWKIPYPGRPPLDIFLQTIDSVIVFRDKDK